MAGSAHESAAGASVRESVRKRYAEAARSGSCCGSSSSDREGAPARSCSAPAFGAPASSRAASSEPGSLLNLGCGNPLPLAEIQPGETILDLGSGSGAEVLLAARLVGPAGKAIGVDMTDEMLELARHNLSASGLANVEFLKGEIESLPLPDASVDVIVSNCVLNLSPDKPAAFSEAFRVLRPGGRFRVADVVIEGSTEPAAGWRDDASAWASCTAGALTEAAYARGLAEAGFVDVKLERIAVYGEDAGCGGGEVELASDLISARKPSS